MKYSNQPPRPSYYSSSLMTDNLAGKSTKEIKEQIVRKRTPKSCIRCYSIKRKCDHKKPSCTRCFKKSLPCEYFTEEHVLERCLQRQSNLRSVIHQKAPASRSTTNETISENDTLPTTELNPSPSETEARNFKLIVNSTGEYSKYISLSLFPFSDPSQIVSYIVDRVPQDQDKYVIFDFSFVSGRLNTAADILKMLPSKVQCDRLVAYFFNNIAPFIPILDQEEFEIKYKDLWKNFKTYDDLNNLMVLFAILFSCCVSIQVTNIYLTGKHFSEDDPIDYDKLKYSCFQCVQNIRYLNRTDISPSMSAITALTLMYYVGSFHCSVAVGEVAALLRFSQIVGLHRSLSSDTKSSSVRAFLYSYVVHLDSLVAYYNGLTSYINPDLFEIVRNFPKREKDLKTLHSLTKFHSSIVWTDLLHQLNKIKPSVEEDYVRLNNEYLRSVEKVNSLNAEILTLFPDEDQDYIHLLVSEARLGLRKSAILVHILRLSVANINIKNVHQGESFNYDLVVQALLLINESLMKIHLGVKCNINMMWWVRNSYPLQALSIVLTHILKKPTTGINFENLPVGYEYTKHPDINYSAFDIREEMVVKTMDSIQTIKRTWPKVVQRRFEKICELKEYVFSQRRKQSTTQQTSTLNLGIPSSTTVPIYSSDFADTNAHPSGSTVPKMTFDELLSSLFDGDTDFQSLLFETLPNNL